MMKTNNKNYEIYKEQYLLEKYEKYLSHVDYSLWGILSVIFCISAPLFIFIAIGSLILSGITLLIVFGLIMKLESEHTVKKQFYPFEAWLEKYKTEHIGYLKTKKWSNSISDSAFRSEMEEINKWGTKIS